MAYMTGMFERVMTTAYPLTGDPDGPAVFWARDVLFAHTPGWSNRLAHDGGIVYVQGSDPDHARSIRLVPGWVDRMKRAVDHANR